MGREVKGKVGRVCCASLSACIWHSRFLLLHIYILISILAAALWRVAILLQFLTGLAKSWWAQLMNSASRTATEWKREVERERPSRCWVCQLQLAAGGTRAFAGSQRGVWLLLISYYVQAQAVLVFAICNKCQLKWYLASASILHQSGEEQLNSSARRAKWGWPWARTWQFVLWSCFAVIGTRRHFTSRDCKWCWCWANKLSFIEGWLSCYSKEIRGSWRRAFITATTLSVLLRNEVRNAFDLLELNLTTTKLSVLYNLHLTWLTHLMWELMRRLSLYLYPVVL